MMLFPDALLNSPLFGIGLTVILYAISEIIIDRFSLNIIPPFVIACPLVIAVIVLAPGVEYKQYEAGAEFINFLLGRQPSLWPCPCTRTVKSSWPRPVLLPAALHWQRFRLSSSFTSAARPWVPVSRFCFRSFPNPLRRQSPLMFPKPSAVFRR